MFRTALAVTVALSLASAASAQDLSKLPSKEEIDARIKEGLERLPPTEAKIEGVVTFTYKAVPTSPEKIAELAGGADKLPPGVKPEQAMKQYMPLITQSLSKHLEKAGTIEAKKAIKVRSKTIPVGKHEFGFAFDGATIVAMVVYVEGEKPIAIKLKSKQTPAQEELKIILLTDEKKDDRFAIGLEFLYQVSQSSTIKVDD